ncbi:unnamed protein product [Hymenolepis diminuta]|uniref:Protein-ribulosamine 3-kinase n=1 Tax=Hymenolepis diminuta TaxID=6216 RepID=A0A0R3SYJ9_HYMDI|nr:unnamed protein product [Hymenolepis diminuta]
MPSISASPTEAHRKMSIRKELTKRATVGGQGGTVTACFHVQHLHHVYALSTANYVVYPLEIKTARGSSPCSPLIEEKRRHCHFTPPPTPPSPDHRVDNFVEWR